MAEVPLVPAALAGTDKLLTLGPLRVAFGEPIELGDVARGDMRLASQEATERLMASITELEASL
jgi:1-acyl-sn-glycerol-3-phosphate acyltransferase